MRRSVVPFLAFLPFASALDLNAQWTPSGQLLAIQVIENCALTGGDIAVAQPGRIIYCQISANHINANDPGAGHFYYVHEFGHHIVGSSEPNADCWAARQLRGVPNGRYYLEAAYRHFYKRGNEFHPGYGTGYDRAKRVKTCGGLDADEGSPESESRATFAIKLKIWPKSPGYTGAEMDVYIDGEYASAISNLEDAETVDLGNLAPGQHKFELRDLTGYAVSQNGNVAPFVSHLKCSGSFNVSRNQTFGLAVQFDGSSVRCQFR